MRITLIIGATLLGVWSMSSPAEAQPCCAPRPVHVRPVYVHPAPVPVRPVYRVQGQRYRPTFRIPWSIGLHVTGISTNQRVGDEGVALGGMGGHVRMRGYRWGTELSLDVLGNRFLEGGVERVAVPLQVSGMLYLVPRGQLQVYLLGGAQAVFSHVTWNLPNLSTDQTFTQVGLHAGVGAELFLSRRFALTADLRVFGLARSDEADDGVHYAGIDQEAVVPQKTSGMQANIGVNYHF
ncbi:MAG: outer membrane beta-barrel protein [Deltaproteobacteria bacterium]|nr:outer membrane beta-barrel protein [Deltaproteobacteria bacterium]